MIEDVASGNDSFDTVSSVDGYVGLLFIKIPIQVCQFSIISHGIETRCYLLADV